MVCVADFLTFQMPVLTAVLVFRFSLQICLEKSVKEFILSGNGSPVYWYIMF
jgi:hypothetical protein